MYENEREETHGWFHVYERAGGDPWVELASPKIDGELRRLDAFFASDPDGITVEFAYATWEGELILDRKQAVALHDRLGAAIAHHDREMAERRRDEWWVGYCRSRVGCTDESPHPAVVERADDD
jgi:hypothetical protein